METVAKKLYEGMFLFDSVQGADWDATVKAVETVLKRVDAEIVSIRKWDERKLAYEIDRQTRGTYLLAYFRVEGEMIKEIEKASQLSDKIMRVLILSAEHMTAEAIEKDTPALKAEKIKQKQKASQAVADDNRSAEEQEPVAEVSSEPEAVSDESEQQAESDTAEEITESDEVRKDEDSEPEEEPMVSPESDKVRKDEYSEPAEEPTVSPEAESESPDERSDEEELGVRPSE